tara:strand:+ start:252 stop:578 length:327 start_codon:yes stop_codon:yes gene_type:complete
MSDELGNFQIRDRVPQAVGKSGNQSEAEAPSAGFAQIETLLDTDQVDLAQIDAQIQKLQDLNGSNAPARDRGSAKKAIKAFQRTRELLQHLTGIKEQMTAQLTENQTE